jgi:hypothetical protein
MHNTPTVLRIFISLAAAAGLVGSRAAEQSSEPPENGVTNTIPQIVMDTVSLPDAIRNLAHQLRLNTTLDPALSARGKQQLLSQEVSLRFENVTPRQALVALLDNYGLVLREDSASRSALIVLKPERKADPASRRGEN